MEQKLCLFFHGHTANDIIHQQGKLLVDLIRIKIKLKPKI